MRQHWSRVLRYRLAPEAHSAGVRSMSACAPSQCAAGQEAPGVPMWRIRTWSWLCRRSGATTHGCASQAALIGCTRCRGCSSDVTHSLPRKGARRLLVFLGIRWAGGHAVVCVVCCGCVGILSMSGRYPGLFSLTAETSSRSWEPCSCLASRRFLSIMIPLAYGVMVCVRQCPLVGQRVTRLSD